MINESFSTAWWIFKDAEKFNAILAERASNNYWFLTMKFVISYHDQYDQLLWSFPVKFSSNFVILGDIWSVTRTWNVQRDLRS